MIQGNDIVCFGSADWDHPFKTNQHHIVSLLSEKNRVLFVESLGLRQPVVQKKDIRRIIKRLIKGFLPLRKKSRNLTVFSPLVIPFFRFALIRELNSFLLNIYMKIVLSVVGMKRPLLWFYSPGAVNVISGIRHRAVVYHCVDELTANPLISGTVGIMEKELISKADVIFATSLPLYESKKKHNSNVYYLPNVADFRHFNRAMDEKLQQPCDIRSIRNPIAGFVGAVSEYKLDMELIIETARSLDDFSFVFIGPLGEGEKAADITEFKKQKNIYIFGPKSYGELPQYIRCFNVCLLPSRINRYTRNMFPLKFFEYLAAGKPVVATDIPSIRDFSDYYYVSYNTDDFIANIKKALKEDSKDRAMERAGLASGFTWERRIEEMSEIIEKV